MFILGTEQPWWQTTAGMVTVLGAIGALIAAFAAAITAIIKQYFLSKRLNIVEDQQKEVAATVEGGKVQDDRLRQLEDRTANILKDLPSGSEGRSK